MRDLHTLKGVARMVEITPIGDLAHELEFLYELLAAGRHQCTVVRLAAELPRSPGPNAAAPAALIDTYAISAARH